MGAGDEAEDLVQLWATRAGLTINRSSRDRFGWDQLFDLNLPVKQNPFDLLGLESTIVSGRIQIKEIRGQIQSRSCSVKLSNWRFAIDDPLPWFFVIVTFSEGSDEPREVAAVHVDKEQIERVLQKLYSLDETKLKALHRLRLQLKWTGQHVLSRPYKQALRELVASVAPNGLHEYAARKRALVESVGFASPRVATAKISFTASSVPEAQERFSRALVGLEESFDVDDVSMQFERFGAMHHDRRIPRGVSGKVAVGPTSDNEGFYLHLVDDKESRVASLPVTYLSSVGVADLPKEVWLSRAHSKFIDLVFHHKTGECSLKFMAPESQEVVVPVSELSMSLEMLFAFDASEHSILKVLIEKSGQEILSGQFSRSKNVGEGLRQLRDRLRAIHKLSTLLGVRQGFTISVMDALRFHSAAILMLDLREGRTGSALTLETTVTRGVVADGDVVVSISDIAVILDGTAFVEIVALKGQVRVLSEDVKGTRFQVLSSDVRSVYRHVCSVQDLEKVPFDRIVDEVEPQFLREGVKVVLSSRLAT